MMSVRRSVPLDHRCPACGANRYQPCATIGGHSRIPHLQRKQRARAARHEPRRYILNADHAQLGLAVGDVLVCEPFWLDPHVTATVLLRESDRFAPGSTLGWGDLTPVVGRAGVVHDVEAIAA